MQEDRHYPNKSVGPVNFRNYEHNINSIKKH